MFFLQCSLIVTITAFLRIQPITHTTIFTTHHAIIHRFKVYVLFIFAVLIFKNPLKIIRILGL